MSVTFAPRLKLHPSNNVLTFNVTGHGAAEATLAFSAGLRIPTGSVVELIAEADVPVMGSLTVVSHAEAISQSPMLTGKPAAVASWTGSGSRTGTLTLRLEAAPGIYQVPVRLRLETRQ